MEHLTPPPVRRLQLDDPRRPARPRRRAPARATATARPRRGGLRQFAQHRRIGPPQFSIRGWRSSELSVAYGDKLAVKEVSLPIRQGEVLALIGPSGCGKTTLLRSLNRLTELTRTASLRGRITLDGVDITRDRADLAAAPGDDGLPAAEPVPDERVRQHRLRPARAGVAAAAQADARAARSTARSTAPGCTTRSRTTSATRR